LSYSAARGRPWAFLSLVVMLAACGGDDASTPSTPTVTRQTRTFTGTLGPGADIHQPIAVTAAGSMDVTLTTTETRARPRISVTVGTEVGALVGQQTGSPSAQVTANVTAQTYILHIENFGDSVPMPYTLTVVAP
jgi:hypothetical protein